MIELARSRALVRAGFAAALCFALLGLMPSTASAAIGFVQQKNGNSASATSLPVPFTSVPTTTAGNVLIMVGGTSTGSLSGVSGGGVGNWFRAQSSTTNTHIEIWYGAVDVATLTSSTPVTITAATAGGMWMTLMEFSGVSLAIDQTMRQAGTTSPASAPSITTTNASDLVILGIADSIGNNFGSLTPAAGWTALTAVTTPVAQSSWYQIAAAGTFNPSATETAHSWDAAIVAFKGCAATTSDASYLTANGQNGVVNIYWASPNPVLILRNTTNSFTVAPTNGTAYKVGDANLGTATIVYSGSGNVAPGTFNQSIANGTYYYKVYTNCGLIYSTGVVLTVVPATTSLWSYATTAATLAPPGIDDNNVVIWGGNDNKIHGADANTGILKFPVFTQPTGAIQARPTIIPAAYSQTTKNVAYATSQDGNVYAIDTATGAQLWKKSLTAVNKLQGGVAVWLQLIQPLSICGATTDVVFVGTRDTATTTGNIVYALNGGTSQVTTTAAGGTCVAATVNPGDVLWTFTGNATFKLDAIVSTPYVDYTTYAGNKYALWVTSNAASGLLQPSLWKFNVQNGTLFSGNTTSCTAPATSCWSLGHTDISPSASGDGTWIYVGTNCIPAGCATQAATLNAVEVSSGTVKTYSPGTGGFNGTGNIRNPYPLLSTSFGTQGTINYVNTNSFAQTSGSATSCAVDMASATPSTGMTAGNTAIVAVAYPIATKKVMNVTDQRGTFYTRRRNTSTTGLTIELWSGIIAAGSGTIVTVSFGSTTTTSICAVAQYSGVGAVANNVASATAGTTANASVSTPAATLDTNNWAVAAFVYNTNAAFANGTAGTLRTSTTISTTLGAAIYDNSSATKATVANTINHTAGTWAAVVVELRSATVDQIIYVRDQTVHAIQFAGNLAAANTTTFNATWQSSPGVSVSSVVDDGVGRLYLGFSNGKVQQYDTWSGFNGVWGDATLRPSPQVAPLTTTTLGDPSYDGVLNRLYIGGNDGRVYAVTTPW